MAKKQLPLVVFVFGLPGSGKSYFAERLARRINATYLSSDRLRNQKFQHKTYSDKEKQSVYLEMLARMRHSIDEEIRINGRRL